MRRPPTVATGRGRSGGESGPLVDEAIPSEFAASREIQKLILQEVASRGYGQQATFAIKLALEEAMINAIKHGNRLDLSKTVYVRATVTPSHVEIIIEDQGAGFDRASVPNPTLEENLEKCSGRGILLIEAYMSQVEWSNGGRRLRMVKKNEPDESGRA